MLADYVHTYMLGLNFKFFFIMERVYSVYTYIAYLVAKLQRIIRQNESVILSMLNVWSCPISFWRQNGGWRHHLSFFHTAQYIRLTIQTSVLFCVIHKEIFFLNLSVAASTMKNWYLWLIKEYTTERMWFPNLYRKFCQIFSLLIAQILQCWHKVIKQKLYLFSRDMKIFR